MNKVARLLFHGGGSGRRRGALVTGMVDGSHAVPIAMTGLYRGITIGWGEQQIGSHKLAGCVLLLTPIDAITGQIRFYVYGPGDVDFGRVSRSPDNSSGNHVPGCGWREDILRGHQGGGGVAGLERVPLGNDYGANGIEIGLAKIE